MNIAPINNYKQQNFGSLKRIDINPNQFGKNFSNEYAKKIEDAVMHLNKLNEPDFVVGFGEVLGSVCVDIKKVKDVTKKALFGRTKTIEKIVEKDKLYYAGGRESLDSQIEKINQINDKTAGKEAIYKIAQRIEELNMENAR